MSSTISYVGGRLMPHDEATAELAQRNISSSGGFYDAERTFGGEVFNLRAHLDRLYESLDFANMGAGMDIEQMEAVTVEVLSSNRPQRRYGEEFTLTQIVARADGENGGAGSTSVAILCEQLDFSGFASGYRDGVRVITPITYAVPRQTGQNGLQESSDPYLLVTGAKDHVTECLHANFMFANKGRVKLPDTQKVLPGVSMATVLEIAASGGIPVDDRRLQRSERIRERRGLRLQHMVLHPARRYPERSGARGGRSGVGDRRTHRGLVGPRWPRLRGTGHDQPEWSVNPTCPVEEPEAQELPIANS